MNYDASPGTVLEPGDCDHLAASWVPRGNSRTNVGEQFNTRAFTRYIFVIPRVAFMKAWENLGSAGNLGNTAA